MIREWADVVKMAAKRLKDGRFSVDYVNRLKFEIEQIDVQGANEYWVDLVRDGKKFDHNRNGLVLPFLLNLTDIDPITYKHVYKFDDDGVDDDVIDLTMEDGSVISLPAKAHIKTKSSNKLVSSLKVGDEI